MNQPLFIESAVAISAQDSFLPEQFLREVHHTDRGWHSLIDAPYQDYINPVAIRRMSRILKVGISAAMAALRRSGIASPDAIITGTGRGVVTDMEQFVKDMMRLKEATLNPTLFIQSTYNAANGWIAMQSKCQGYNQTYVHRGISFELALQDAMMLVAEDAKADCVLCGSFDEMTAEHYHIQSKVGNWRDNAIDSLDLFRVPGKGSIGGEGSTFFTCCRDRRDASSLVSGMRIVYEPDGQGVESACKELLDYNHLEWADVDLLVSGYNGDSGLDDLYEGVHACAERGGGTAFFKHLCGEYSTASAFGLWLSDFIFRNNIIHPALRPSSNGTGRLRNILLVNASSRQTASVLLVQSANR